MQFIKRNPSHYYIHNPLGLMVVKTEMRQVEIYTLQRLFPTNVSMDIESSPLTQGHMGKLDANNRKTCNIKLLSLR